MELIKKIKQAEAQAQTIIEQAKTDAARQAEQARENCAKALAEAEQQRKKAIDAAVAAAGSQSAADVKDLRSEAEKQRRQLHDKANRRIPAAVAKVMDYVSKPSS
jgi:V/A-type H+-transporting ATPase subunit G/H